MAKRWASFVSGGGTTMAAILDAVIQGRLTGIVPALIVASKPEIGAIKKVLQRIRDHGSKLELRNDDIVVASPRLFAWPENWAKLIADHCRSREIDVVTQNGWLPKTPATVIEAVNGNIFNQHPGPLDPGRKYDFGGGGDLGMYGRRVHCARLLFARWTERNDWTEALSHYVVPDVDKGQIVHLRTVEILPDDTVESLQERVLPVEHEVQIETLQMFADGKIKPYPIRLAPLVRSNQVTTLIRAKSIARDLYPQG